jgi:hypothetical protein
MADESNEVQDTPQAETHGRRDFLKKAGKAAMAAPALALILKAEKTHAWGRDLYGGGKVRDYDRLSLRRHRRRYRRHRRRNHRRD